MTQHENEHMMEDIAPSLGIEFQVSAPASPFTQSANTDTQPSNDQESDRMIDIDTMVEDGDGLPWMQTPILTEIMADHGQPNDVADTQNSNPRDIGQKIDEIQRSLYPPNPDMGDSNPQTIGQEIDEIQRSLHPSQPPSVGSYWQDLLLQGNSGPTSQTISEMAESPHHFALAGGVATGGSVEEVGPIPSPPEIVAPSGRSHAGESNKEVQFAHVDENLEGSGVEANGDVMSDAESNHVFNSPSEQSFQDHESESNSQDLDSQSVPIAALPHAYNPFSPSASPEPEYIVLDGQDEIQHAPYPVQAAENGVYFGVGDVEMEEALATMTDIAAPYGNEVAMDDHISTGMPPDSTPAVPEDSDEDLIEKIEDAPAPPYASQAIQRAESEPAVGRQEGSGLAPMQQQRAESYRTALEEERASRRQDARQRFRFGRKFRRRREGSGASEDSGRRYTFDNIRRRWVLKFRNGFKKLNDHVKAFVTGRKHRGGSQTSSSQRKDEEMS